MTYEIKRFDLVSVFKVSFLIYLVIGLLIGLFYSLIIGAVFQAFAPLMEDRALLDMGKIAGGSLFVLALFVAVFMAVVWSVLTVIAVALYNVLAGNFGGIKMDIGEFKLPYAPALTSSLPRTPPPS